MARYSVSFSAVATLASAGSFKTLVGLKFANTLGHRGRVLSIVMGAAGEAPQDVNIEVELTKSDNTTDGGTSATTVTPKPFDPLTIASRATAKINYNNGGAADEPTTVDSTSFFKGAFNARGLFVKEWAPGEGPLWGQAQTALLRAAPGSNAAVKISGCIEWEE